MTWGMRTERGDFAMCCPETGPSRVMAMVYPAAPHLRTERLRDASAQAAAWAGSQQGLRKRGPKVCRIRWQSDLLCKQEGDLEALEQERRGQWRSAPCLCRERRKDRYSRKAELSGSVRCARSARSTLAETGTPAITPRSSTQAACPAQTHGTEPHMEQVLNSASRSEI